MKNKISSYLLSIILAISIILFSLLSAIFYTSYNLNYYNDFQKENSINQVTGKSFEYLEKVNIDIIDYLKDGDDNLLESHFNEREILHMQDVFLLYELARNLFLISLAIILIIIILSRLIKLDNLFKKTSIVIFIIFIIVFIFATIVALDFDRFFTLFHHIFFDNDLWILDPRTDMMIQMMPLRFFIGHGIRIALVTLIISLVVGLFLFYLGKKEEKNNAIHRK